MAKVLFATFVSAVSAVVLVALVAAAARLLAGGSDKPWEVALHFAFFGSVIVFPIAFVAAPPLYYLFRWRGWLTPSAVLVGGVTLALVYPLIVWAENQPGVVSWWHFFVCAIAGAAASVVFCNVAGVRHVQGQL